MEMPHGGYLLWLLKSSPLNFKTITRFLKSLRGGIAFIYNYHIIFTCFIAKIYGVTKTKIVLKLYLMA